MERRRCGTWRHVPGSQFSMAMSPRAASDPWRFLRTGARWPQDPATGPVKFWDVAARTEIATLEGHNGWVYSVAFSEDGSALASGSQDGTVRIWDVAARTEIATLEGHSGWVYSVAFSEDGSALASGSQDGTVRIWDVAARTEIATLEGHSDWVYSVAFLDDANRLVSGSRDGTMLLWDLSAPEPPPVTTPRTPVADFNGDGAVGFADFVLFAQHFGLRQGDAGFDARYDLDEDGAIAFSDFVEFAGAFGQG